MRYEGWDVMLFPLDPAETVSNVPFPEFHVRCEVVADREFSDSTGSTGIATVTGFIPALYPGSPFRVSIHSWGKPEISCYTRSLNKNLEPVRIEARVVINGRVMASCNFDRDAKWPQDIFHTFAITNNGDLDFLRFPPFRPDVLAPQSWSAGDPFGRIKVVLSEGFPRDSMDRPIERVKNLVAFSFQHAPLDLLERYGIAWPNQSMWNQSAMLSFQPTPAYHLEAGPGSHAHSPNRPSEPNLITATAQQQLEQQHLEQQQLPPPHQPAYQTAPNARLGIVHPGCNGSPVPDQDAQLRLYAQWLKDMQPGGGEEHGGEANPGGGCGGDGGPGGMRPAITAIKRLERTDTSMPDYPGSTECSSMSFEFDNANMDWSGVGPDLGSGHLQGPTNTPSGGHENTGASHFEAYHPIGPMPVDFSASLTNSLLNQPIPLSGQAQHDQVSGGAGRVQTETPLQGATLVNGSTQADISTVPGGQPNPFSAGQPNPFSGKPNPFSAGQSNPFSGDQSDPFEIHRPPYKSLGLIDALLSTMGPVPGPTAVGNVAHEIQGLVPGSSPLDFSNHGLEDGLLLRSNFDSATPTRAAVVNPFSSDRGTRGARAIIIPRSAALFPHDQPEET